MSNENEPITSYTTISLKPKLKKVLRHLKDDTYGKYIEELIPEEDYEEAVETLRENGELPE